MELTYKHTYTYSDCLQKEKWTVSKRNVLSDNFCFISLYTLWISHICISQMQFFNIQINNVIYHINKVKILSIISRCRKKLWQGPAPIYKKLKKKLPEKMNMRRLSQHSQKTSETNHIKHHSPLNGEKAENIFSQSSGLKTAMATLLCSFLNTQFWKSKSMAFREKNRM